MTEYEIRYAFWILAGIAVIAGLWSQHGHAEIAERFTRLLTPLGAVCALGTIIVALLVGPFWNWNGARLAPTFALAAGLPIYPHNGEGAVLGWIYGPISALAYLPATLAGTPHWALLIAGLMSFLFLIIPACTLLRITGRRLNVPITLSLASCLLFFFFAIQMTSLRYSLFAIHADAPAIGLVALSCTVLFLRRSSINKICFPLAALFGVLGVWSKQTVAPALLATIAFIALADGKKAALRYTFTLLAIGLVVSLAMIAAFGFDPVFENMFSIPTHHPMRVERIPIFLFSLGEISIPCLAGGSILSMICIMWSGSRIERSRRWWQELAGTQDWILLLLIAIFMLPTALLNRSKVGGDYNAHSLVTYFLYLGVFLAMQSYLAAAQQEPKFMRKVVLAVMAIALMTFSITNIPSPAGITKYYSGLAQCGSTRAYEFCRLHPGKAYFPDTPLAHLMAERKAYHFSYGIYDRTLAAKKVSQEYFRRYMPPNPEMIIRDTSWLRDGMMDFLAGYVEPRHTQDGWVIFLRKDLATGGHITKTE